LENERVIAQTKKWIEDVVVGCNFCPFAAKEVKRGSIRYVVAANSSKEKILEELRQVFLQMDFDKNIETSLLIFSGVFTGFDDYLELLIDAEDLLFDRGYEGIYQIASFHPEYLFEGSKETDPANYTNRSPYPMFHVLREESVSAAIDSHPDTENIPQRNIEFARQKGLAYMLMLRNNSMKSGS
jgi:hypothetical protein